MARDRQRAKQRQAERRAKRLAQQGGSGVPDDDGRDAADGRRRAEAAAADAPPRDDVARADAEAPARDDRADAPPRDDATLIDDPTAVDPSPAVPPELAVGAPPQDEGHSEAVLRGEQEPPLTADEAWQEIEDWEVGADQDEAGEPVYAPRGRRGATPDEAERARKRPRVVQFLVAVWAELQRVQWPDRQALTTLTGVVLGFVLIAGGYLGLLDAIVSRIVNALL